MMGDKQEPPNLPTVRTSTLRDLAARLVAAGDSEVATIIRALQIEARTIDVIDLWEPRETAITYWVLLMTGVNHSDEMQIAKDLLAWQTFFAKDSARVLCVQSSEHEAFRCCSARFSVHDFPTLVMSDSPDMQNHIRVQTDLLKQLSSDAEKLQRFLAKLQTLVEHGHKISDLKDIINAEVFWNGLKVAFKEVKGLISITLTPK